MKHNSDDPVHTVYFRRCDIAEFAEMMDSVMHSKEIERELDGSFYTDNLSKVIKECDIQVKKLGTISSVVEATISNELVGEQLNHLSNQLGEMQKRAVHVANYCMMLFGIAQNKAFELDKLRKRKDNRSTEKHYNQP